MRRPPCGWRARSCFRTTSQEAQSWHWGNHSLVTLHLALKSAPVYRSQSFDPEIARAYNIFFGMDDIDQVASCFDDCAKEKFPDVLMGNGACNSAVDPTYAPADGHSAFWWPFAPYAIGGDPTEWDRGKAEYTERVLGVWREYASNLGDDNIRAKFLFTPLDVERLNVNMVRGAVRMGAYIPSQLGINRPHPLLSGTRTPIEGLYLCGSSDRKRRRHQRGAGLHRSQRHRRRPQARAAVDPRAATRMAALREQGSRDRFP